MDEIIDIHVHFGAPPDQQSGCFWSKEFEKTAAYYVMLFLTNSLFKKITLQRVQEHLINAINKSKEVDKCVLLSMDKVFDESGNAHDDLTHLFVPNNYIIHLAEENDKILFGASIHPYKNNWEEELDYCLKNNAVLCKWIPSSQLINPESPQCIPFYKKLAAHNLPLLCHAGPEYAIPTSNKKFNKYNNPKYLRNALNEGVTVILAHCSMPYFGYLDRDYYDDFEDFLKLFDEAHDNDWKLFADVSAVTTLLREPFVKKVKERIPKNKLVFGSDYPIPPSEFCYSKIKGFYSWMKFVAKMLTTKNQIDKNFYLIEKMDFGDTVFTNPNKLFKLIKYQQEG